MKDARLVGVEKNTDRTDKTNWNGFYCMSAESSLMPSCIPKHRDGWVMFHTRNP